MTQRAASRTERASAERLFVARRRPHTATRRLAIADTLKTKSATSNGSPEPAVVTVAFERKNHEDAVFSESRNRKTATLNEARPYKHSPDR